MTKAKIDIGSIKVKDQPVIGRPPKSARMMRYIRAAARKNVDVADDIDPYSVKIERYARGYLKNIAEKSLVSALGKWLFFKKETISVPGKGKHKGEMVDKVVPVFPPDTVIMYGVTGKVKSVRINGTDYRNIATRMYKKNRGNKHGYLCK